MAVADIKNNIIRRTIVVILVPFAFVVYMAFGATKYVSVCIEDISSAWKGASR